MLIKQISVFVENKPGRLAEITSVISGAGVDIRALSIADTTDFGILRLIVNRPDEAERALREAGMTVSITHVIAIGIDDQPGGFAGAVKVLAESNITIEYMYAFISRDHKKAYVIIRVDDNEKAIGALTGKVEILPCQEIYN